MADLREVEKLLCNRMNREHFVASCLPKDQPHLAEIFKHWNITLKSLRWEQVVDFISRAHGFIFETLLSLPLSLSVPLPLSLPVSLLSLFLVFCGWLFVFCGLWYVVFLFLVVFVVVVVVVVAFVVVHSN